MKLSLVIPAAGSGSRLGSEIPKPFIELCGKPILRHTLERFLRYDKLAQIVIATSAEQMERVEAILKDMDLGACSYNIVEGGSERQYSIWNALQEVDESCGLVAVHDAVRPFISEGLIRRCCEQAAAHGGAVVGVPAKDTIKKVNEHAVITETPDRSLLWQAQTPQVFKRDLIFKAYREAIDNGLLGTDDSSLAEAVGGTVVMVEGERENLKITYPIDLRVAELILKEEE